jgi:hypothetical protein
VLKLKEGSRMKKFMRLWSLAVVLLFVAPVPLYCADSEIVYWPATHSHNDYRQPRPLRDALESGMNSIEADAYYIEIHFTDDQGNERVMRDLYVAHDWEEIEGTARQTVGRLTEKYLDPLWGIYHKRGGVIYPQGPLYLHVDMKTETVKTWTLLQNVLQNFPGLVTRYDLRLQTVIPGPVVIYTNAEPDEDVLSEHPIIYCTVDGRFGNIYDPKVWDSPEYLSKAWRIPIVSSNLRSYNDLNQFFDFLVPKEEIVEDYATKYPGLTVDNLVSRLPDKGWALANELIKDRKIRPSDYLINQMKEADRLGKEHNCLMRFWAPPDAKWFWDIVALLENVMLVTDRPKDVAIYLESLELLKQIQN